MNNPEIIFEDSDIVAVNKPAGMIVHSAPGHTESSLADYLAKSRRGMYDCGSRERPGVVHRLDIGTSGVMVFAKTIRAYRALREAFESHGRIRKTYLAVLHGSPKMKTGRIENTIGRKPWDSKRMAVDVPDGKRAVSEWTVLAKKSGVSLVEFVIETGRTHQIRVHAAHLGCPIVGDELYGDSAKDRHLRQKPVRTLLHAVEITLPHPVSGEIVTFAAEPPADIVYAIP
ncbi:MAG: RluA family pseudouridine synthase [Kiritimatiellae bacterium]|nr:RluA family pseudouridine synthase [Kiritimatiellia bacterium]